MSFLNELTLQQILGRLAAFVVITGLHGFILAGLARLFGDRGPQYDERLSLWPGPHLSMPGIFAAILFRLGWIRPMDIDPTQLRFGRWGLVLIVVASLALTLALVPLVMGLRPLVLTTLPMTTANATINIITIGADLVLWFVVLNLLPLPPLTGAHLLYAAFPSLPKRLKRQMTAASTVLFILCVLGTVEWALAPLVAPLRLWLIG